MLTRRDFLGRGFAAAALAASFPGLALARAATDARLVVVILRGALDGLGAVAPYGDGRYAAARGALALAPPGGDDGLRKLDGLFGMHPALSTLHEWYRAREAAVVHAVASPYRERSHFDAQNLLENGTDRPFGASDGWLNRAIAHLPASPDETRREAAIAVAQNVPLILRGPGAVGSWAPSTLPGLSDDTIARIADLYAPDAFFSERLSQALQTDAMAPEDGRRSRFGPQQFVSNCAAAGRFLEAADGPRIAVLESTGWDTHANQGTVKGQLTTHLTFLDRGMAAMRRTLAGAWPHAMVLVVTEFGRTVAVNGTGGTDHGTASVAFVSGGAVRGGRVLGDWPGLATQNLYEARDLRPTTDLRAIFKAALLHMQVDGAALDTAIFPGSADVRAMSQLLR